MNDEVVLYQDKVTSKMMCPNYASQVAIRLLIRLSTLKFVHV
jgi:hypothetical protein